MISFQNEGLIDIRAVTTMGVSVKETENPIGFFGTGLKYALAIILRERGKVSIWRGLDEYRFATARVSIRGSEVEIVTMNGVELGFTISLGKNWEAWQAFRELYCNAKDEGGAFENGRTLPAEGRTTVHVECEKLEVWGRRIGELFLMSPPLESGNLVEFHDRPGIMVYYRGVRVNASPSGKPYRFTPNLVASATLTEDRTLASMWEFGKSLSRSVLMSSEAKFIERWLTAGREYVEHEHDLDWDGITPSAEFLDVVRRIAADKSRLLNTTALAVLRRCATLPDVVACELLPGESQAVAKAVAFCRALGYAVDDYPITFVESLGAETLGLANLGDRTILIARRAVGLGDLTLAGTLLEEWIHLKHGHGDESRGMQNFLLDAMMRLGREYLLASGRMP